MHSDLRAVLRLARRHLSTTKRTNAVLVVLIALPVAFTTWGLTIARTVNPGATDLVNATIGKADLYAINPSDASVAALPAGSSVETMYRSTEIVSWPSNSAMIEVQRTLAPTPLDATRLRVAKGRLPAREGEATVSLSLRQPGVDLGDSLTIGTRRFTVVGVAFSPTQRQLDTVHIRESESWTPPASWPGYRELLVALPAGARPSPAVVDDRDVRERMPAGETAIRTFETRETLVAQNRFNVDRASISLLAGAVPLAEVSLIVAAVYSVTLERRRRLLQLLSAQGATPRHGLLLVLADAALVGSAGAALGVALGLAIAWGFRWWLQRSLSFVADGLRFSVLWVVLGALFAVVATMFAALRPAQNVLRESMATVPRSDVRRLPASPARLAVGTVIAIAALFAASSAENMPKAALTVIGIGFAVITGGALAQRLFAVASGRAVSLPVPIRLALRELARKKSRTAALTVALVSALCGCIAVVSSLHSFAVESRRTYRPSLPSNQLLMKSQNGQAVDAVATAIRAPQRVEFFDTFVPYSQPGVSVSAHQIAHQPLGLEAFVAPARLGEKSRPARVGVVSETSLTNLGLRNNLADFRSGKAIALTTGSVRDAQVQLSFDKPALAAVERAGAEDPGDLDLPTVLISNATAKRIGLIVSTSVTASLLVLDHRATSQEIAAANRAAANFNEVVIVERGFHDATQSIRVGASLFVGILALALVALITSLVLSESAATMATLRALGARPSLRRSQGAAVSGFVTIVAALFAVPIGLGVARVAVAPAPFAAPALLIASLVICVTAVAVFGGAAFTRTSSR